MSEPSPRRRPSAALLVSSLALVAALAPPAYAALAAGSVGTAQLKNGSVTTSKLKASAVNASRVLDGSLYRGDLHSSARAQRSVTGTIQSNRRYQDAIPAGGVVGSLAGRYGSGELRMPAAGKLLVNGYVILNNNDSTNVRSATCDVLVDGVRRGGSGPIYMQAAFSTQFSVQAAGQVAAGSHDVAISCESNYANFIDIGVNVQGITGH